MSDLDVFRSEFVPNIETHAKLSFTTWQKTAPADYARWVSYRDALLAEQSPATPSMTTKYGKALVAAGKLVTGQAGGCLGTMAAGWDMASGTHKRFYGPAQLGATATTLYTVPAGKRILIQQIHVSNPSGNTVDLTLSVGTDAAGTRVWDDYPIPARGVYRQRDDLMLMSGESIQAYASSAGTLVVTMSGLEADQLFTPPSYKGMDYVTPTRGGMPVGCDFDWTWLMSACGAANLTRLDTDIDYIVANDLGTFQRVWVSLDQMFSSFDPDDGFGAYDSTALSNLHSALALFDAAGMKVALVAFANANTNDFHFEALDGSHATMLANYVEAFSQFMEALAGNSTSTRAVAVVDMLNEAYYQAETVLVPTYGDNATVDARVLDFLTDLYAAGKAAAPSIPLTASDTGRLLTDQETWVDMYPIDVYDIHLYDADPWNDLSKYQAGLTLPKPWFAGEAGADPGSPDTYDGDLESTITLDEWWLDNMQLYGAKAVLIEDKGTLFIRGDPSYTLRGVGQMVSTY